MRDCARGKSRITMEGIYFRIQTLGHGHLSGSGRILPTYEVNLPGRRRIWANHRVLELIGMRSILTSYKLRNGVPWYGTILLRSAFVRVPEI
jgi:hypothetical protein